MKTIKGIYENGQIKLLEESPVKSRNKVLITFIENDDDDELRFVSLSNETEDFKNYLSDNREDLYQDYLKK